MIKFFKPQGTQNWAVRCTNVLGVPDGQWSTGTPDFQQALEVAALRNLAGRIGKLRGKTKKRLRRALQDVYRLAAGDEDELLLYNVGEYLDVWIGSHKPFVAGSTFVNQARALKLFREYFQENLGISLEDLSPLHIRLFAAWLIDKAHHSVESANLRLDIIHSWLEMAVKSRLIDENPASGIRAKDRKAELKKGKLIHQAFSLAHLQSFVDNGIKEGCNVEMAVASLLGEDLGCRVGDAFAIKCGDLRLDEGLIIYHIRKVIMNHEVMLFPATVSLLKEYVEHHLAKNGPDEPLFPSFFVSSVDDDSFRHGSARASGYYGRFLQAIGIRPPVAPRIVNGRDQWDHSFHSHRPTVSTALKLVGVSIEAVMARMPHKSQEVSKVYDRFTVYNICAATFGPAGIPVSQQVKAKSSVTIKEIFAEMERAQLKLVSLRGKVALCRHTPHQGDLTLCAMVLPPGTKPPRKPWTRKPVAEVTAGTGVNGEALKGAEGNVTPTPVTVLPAR